MIKVKSRAQNGEKKYSHEIYFRLSHKYFNSSLVPIIQAHTSKYSEIFYMELVCLHKHMKIRGLAIVIPHIVMLYPTRSDRQGSN